ncbi:hypothetical protein JQ633_19865 [Bradyrhizobium tropiciagri]|uniref:hypothetical protein n=1 Tax=Bradyrhizobium tropiciagri TaxID=312253 RepID=UPI001BA80530|nr:hypothetical protein [Bradyrhizobium tropiciagri]MBR0872629.1 hypothetical protein [Bradyrhizobium tropiciagri]
MTKSDDPRKNGAAEEEIFSAGATHVEIDGLDPKAALRIIEADSKAGRFGRASGFCFVIAGLMLILLGAAGGTTIAVSLVGLSINLNDAAPGIVLAIVGLSLYFVYRPNVTIVSKRK